MKNVDWNVYIEEEWEIIKVYVIFFFKFDEDVHIYMYYKIQGVLGKGINFVYFRVKFCKNCGWKMLIEMYIYIEEEREDYEIIKVYIIFFFKFNEDMHIYYKIQGILGILINFVYFRLIFKFLIDFFLDILLDFCVKKINRNKLKFFITY